MKRNADYSRLRGFDLKDPFVTYTSDENYKCATGNNSFPMVHFSEKL